MKKIGIIICFIITAIAAAGIFIYGYQYADWFDENNEENDNDNGDSSVTPNPTPSPNLSPDYEFMQCTASSGTPCCNGLSSNCDKRVNEIAFAMSHNSMSTVEDGFLFANHLYDLGRSLEDGFRGLMLDLCSCDGKPTFCHANCSLGTKDVSETFEEIISFLEKHPSEVIILEFQVEDDGDIFSMYEIMKSIDGFVDRIYVHDIFSDVWPRLSTLVESDKRILLFQHDGPNCNVDGACPEGFHNTYTYMFETSFEIKEVDDLLDSSSCAVTRGNFCK